MRHFIVSDLHGNGYVYDSIVNYLHNELLYGNDDITLHINGDLIDRGRDSSSMLIDVYERVTNNESFKINYLGGNHELMFYNSYKLTSDLRDKDLFAPWTCSYVKSWTYDNGGYVTSTYLKNNYSKKYIDKLCEFVGNLNIYHKFSETINNKPILLIHAGYVTSIDNDTVLKINDGITTTQVALNVRKEDYKYGRPLIGDEKYFTIIGHTPTYNKKGYMYDSEKNVLNIDGGSSIFVDTLMDYANKTKNMFQKMEEVEIDFNNIDEETLNKLIDNSHVALVEIIDERLKILTFNHNNEIIRGNYFDGCKSYPISDNDLSKIRQNLNKNDNVKKRILKKNW